MQLSVYSRPSSVRPHVFSVHFCVRQNVFKFGTHRPISHEICYWPNIFEAKRSKVKVIGLTYSVTNGAI